MNVPPAAIVAASAASATAFVAPAIVRGPLLLRTFVARSLVAMSLDTWAVVSWAFVTMSLVTRTLVAMPIVPRALVPRALISRMLSVGVLVPASVIVPPVVVPPVGVSMTVTRTFVTRTFVARALVTRALVTRALVTRALVTRALTLSARACAFTGRGLGRARLICIDRAIRPFVGTVPSTTAATSSTTAPGAALLLLRLRQILLAFAPRGRSGIVGRLRACDLVLMGRFRLRTILAVPRFGDLRFIAFAVASASATSSTATALPARGLGGGFLLRTFFDVLYVEREFFEGVHNISHRHFGRWLAEVEGGLKRFRRGRFFAITTIVLASPAIAIPVTLAFRFLATIADV